MSPRFEVNRTGATLARLAPQAGGVADDQDPKAGDRLWDDVMARAHAEFAIAVATVDADPVTDRERDLVEVAMLAGAIGALRVLGSEVVDTGR